MARHVAYVCALGCLAECSHGHPCAIYMIDREHPHPTKRGREQHLADDDEGNLHEWNGAHGKCLISREDADA
jgi:hypothetical protein